MMMVIIIIIILIIIIIIIIIIANCNFIYLFNSALKIFSWSYISIEIILIRKPRPYAGFKMFESGSTWAVWELYPSVSKVYDIDMFIFISMLVSTLGSGT